MGRSGRQDGLEWMDGMEGGERWVCGEMVIRWMEVSWIFQEVGTGGLLDLLDGLLLMSLRIGHGMDLIEDMAWSSCSAGYCT